MRTILRAFLVLMCGVVNPALASSTPGPGDYFISPLFRPGDSAVYTISFDALPISSIGPANMLHINTGSSNLDFQSVKTDLYIGDAFAGSYTYGPAANWFAIFVSDDANYNDGFWPATVVDGDLLQALLDGTSQGKLVVTPSFFSPNGLVQFSGWFAHAATASGQEVPAWEDIYPSARIVSVDFNVSEPASLGLTTMALVLAGVLRRRRTRG
jgi:hypothetical protein